MQGRALSPSSLAVPTEDTVFMRDENERREYVLSQNGVIFQGTYDYFVSIPWNFGQVSGQAPLGPLGPLADPDHAALVLQDTGTGAMCVPLANVLSAPWSLPMGQGNRNLVFPRGNVLTSKHGKARRVFPHGSWGPHGYVSLIWVALLCQEVVPDKEFLGTVPGGAIRQCPHPELHPWGTGMAQPPSLSKGLGARSSGGPHDLHRIRTSIQGRAVTQL